mgnify:CR=1 FL=1
MNVDTNTICAMCFGAAVGAAGVAFTWCISRTTPTKKDDENNKIKEHVEKRKENEEEKKKTTRICIYRKHGENARGWIIIAFNIFNTYVREKLY